MINSVKQIVTMKASDLPPTFDVRIGSVEYPFEIDYMDYAYVYMIETNSGETVYVDRNQMMTVLIPDTLENASMDIELDLMTQGIL